MYEWYRHSRHCIVYLEDCDCGTLPCKVEHEGTCFARSRWFTRGWTLQELIAPRRVIFFNSTWEKLNSRKFLKREISDITKIHYQALDGDDIGWNPNTQDLSIAARMSWVANRQTSKPEDLAYCLFGILNVRMTIEYGEGGARAFKRLQEEILKSSNDHSIFTWQNRINLIIPWYSDADNDEHVFRERWHKSIKGPFADSPNLFKYSRDVLSIRPKTHSTMTNLGLHINFELIPISIHKIHQCMGFDKRFFRRATQELYEYGGLSFYIAVLHCTVDPAVNGGRQGNLGIYLVTSDNHVFTRVYSDSVVWVDSDLRNQVLFRTPDKNPPETKSRDIYFSVNPQKDVGIDLYLHPIDHYFVPSAQERNTDIYVMQNDKPELSVYVTAPNAQIERYPLEICNETWKQQRHPLEEELYYFQIEARRMSSIDEQWTAGLLVITNCPRGHVAILFHYRFATQLWYCAIMQISKLTTWEQLSKGNHAYKVNSEYPDIYLQTKDGKQKISVSWGFRRGEKIVDVIVEQMNTSTQNTPLIEEDPHPHVFKIETARLGKQYTIRDICEEGQWRRPIPNRRPTLTAFRRPRQIQDPISEPGVRVAIIRLSVSNRESVKACIRKMCRTVAVCVIFTGNRETGVSVRTHILYDSDREMILGDRRSILWDSIQDNMKDWRTEQERALISDDESCLSCELDSEGMLELVVRDSGEDPQAKAEYGSINSRASSDWSDSDPEYEDEDDEEDAVDEVDQVDQVDKRDERDEHDEHDNSNGSHESGESNQSDGSDESKKAENPNVRPINLHTLTPKPPYKPAVHPLLPPPPLKRRPSTEIRPRAEEIGVNKRPRVSGGSTTRENRIKALYEQQVQTNQIQDRDPNEMDWSRT
ncbi:hypothetical protein FPQ18DRAFT_402836 [Pyronema domesticum]|nr:hypothetical protein FPQ18DRAFT_402836 [Pyronema domesticum]